MGIDPHELDRDPVTGLPVGEASAGEAGVGDAVADVRVDAEAASHSDREPTGAGEEHAALRDEDAGPDPVSHEEEFDFADLAELAQMDGAVLEDVMESAGEVDAGAESAADAQADADGDAEAAVDADLNGVVASEPELPPLDEAAVAEIAEAEHELPPALKAAAEAARAAAVAAAELAAMGPPTLEGTLQGRRVLVLGLGESGLAMARWCAAQGASVRVWDSREDPPHAQALAESVPAAERLSGAFDADRIRMLLDGSTPDDAQEPGAPDDIHWILKSPGLAPSDPRIEPLLDAARAAGVRVSGELDLFARALQALRPKGYQPRVLAVTGTNGKTTTTSMTALLVERAGQSVVAAGNIGPTMLGELQKRLADQSLPQVWVLELSSFQLDDAHDFAPDAAVVLNVTQDHLDWHGTFDAYAKAKARIFGADTVVVVNRDDPSVDAMAQAFRDAEAAAAAASSKRKRAASADSAAAAPVAASPRRIVSFGLSAPRNPGDFGLVEDGMAWLVRAQPNEDLPGGSRRKRAALQDDEPLQLQRLMPADALRVRGRHNASNALAALALVTAIGLPLAPMLHGLREYRGEPHRVERIGRVGEVDAIDDSKGTNVGATVAALLGLGADLSPAKLVVILGGDGKGQDFAPLLAPVARHVRAVALIGRDGPAIGQLLSNDPASSSVPQSMHATLEDATRWSFEQARSGDAVLLSPACASLDMFRNYAHRAEVFAQTVRELALAEGQML